MVEIRFDVYLFNLFGMLLLGAAIGYAIVTVRTTRAITRSPRPSNAPVDEERRQATLGKIKLIKAMRFPGRHYRELYEEVRIMRIKTEELAKEAEILEKDVYREWQKYRGDRRTP